MYIPSHFANTDKAWAHRLIEAHGFALLVTTGDDGAPFVTHLPLLLDADRGPHGALVGHMARGNPQWRHFASKRPAAEPPSMKGEARQALAIFQGPHGYISPSWYATAPQVPTWNYVTVHAYGAPEIIGDAGRVRALLKRLTDTYEIDRPNRWRMEGLAEDYVASMIKGVVAFEMPIARLEAKAKLGQNRKPEDRAGAIKGLRATGDPADADLARLMDEI
jgi:transcriptional regulator